MANLHGHEAGNGGHSQGEPTGTAPDLDPTSLSLLTDVWGGPHTLATKGRIPDGHCATIGRDPRTILRSANMALVISDDAAAVEKVRRLYVARFGGDEAKARDTVLGGSPAAIRDTLGRLGEVGVGMLFVPTMFLPGDGGRTLDRFIEAIAPAPR